MITYANSTEGLRINLNSDLRVESVTTGVRGGVPLKPLRKGSLLLLRS